MKLLYSKASPFARKVRSCAAALRIDGRIELIEVDVTDPPASLTDANPLAKIPTLITEDGFAIFDSPVICEYLNGTSDAIPIIPASGGPGACRPTTSCPSAGVRRSCARWTAWSARS